MKELVVISGKGGTGKTSLVASFAALAKSAVLADCDVDAADLHLVLAPTVERREVFTCGHEAINTEVSRQIEQEVKRRGHTVVAHLPYDPVVTQAQMAGQSVVEYANGSLAEQLRGLWQRLEQEMEKIG